MIVLPAIIHKFAGFLLEHTLKKILRNLMRGVQEYHLYQIQQSVAYNSIQFNMETPPLFPEYGKNSLLHLIEKVLCDKMLRGQIFTLIHVVYV